MWPSTNLFSFEHQGLPCLWILLKHSQVSYCGIFMSTSCFWNPVNLNPHALSLSVSLRGGEAKKIQVNASKWTREWETGRQKKRTDRPRNKIVNEARWWRLVREMYLLTSHSFPNPPPFVSAQSRSITDQMYSPVCAAPVSFPSDTSLVPLVSLENDKTGTTAELSVPHTTGRKLPSFHSSGSISSSRSRAVVYACSFTEIHARPCQFFSAAYIHYSDCIRNME